MFGKNSLVKLPGSRDVDSSQYFNVTLSVPVRTSERSGVFGVSVHITFTCGCVTLDCDHMREAIVCWSLLGPPH